MASGCADGGHERSAQRSSALEAGWQVRLVANDAAELDHFGYAVAVVGERALVGAYGESVYQGTVYSLVRAGDAWLEEQTLRASDGMEGDGFGWSIASAGDRAAVGAPAANDARGAAYVLVNVGDEWEEDQKLAAEDGEQYDRFGWSVAITSGHAVVGAYGDGDLRGAAYAFLRSDSSWTLAQKLLADDGVEGDQFGYAVAASGERVLIGAPSADEARGAAYVFVHADGRWTLEQRLSSADAEPSDQFGASVALAGDRALVGAYWKDALQGAAYVFAQEGKRWIEEQKLTASGGASGHRFGNSLGLAGDRALIGAYAKDDARGAAYLFSRGQGVWTEEQMLVANDGAPNDAMGWSVALGQGYALAGAPFDDVLRGAAYLFRLGQENGARCADDVECASGHCEDERCCNVACSGACSACSVREGAEQDGVCTIFARGAQGSPACESLACTGQGADCAPCDRDADCGIGRHCDGDRTCQTGDRREVCDAERCEGGAAAEGRQTPGGAGASGSGASCQASQREVGWFPWPLLTLGALALARRRVGHVLTALLLFGCNAARSDADPGDPPGLAKPPDAGSFEDGGTAPRADDATACTGAVTTPKRVLRLTEAQLFNAYDALFGEAARVITQDEEAPTAAEREFPPISGELGVSESLFALSDRLAQSAMRHVLQNVTTFASCGDPPSEADCVKRFLLSFAERAFRRPLRDAEASAITGTFWAEMNEAGANPTEALGYGMYGILVSPGFLYRTEFGSDASVEGRLSQVELANTLSWFLTDRPPDEVLLAAAAAGELGTPDQVRAEVTRILDTSESRENLERALFGYFGLGRVPQVIVNAEAVPGLTVTRGLLSAIHREGELFLEHQLWSGTLGDLLTTRQTWANAQLATEVYGVAAPSRVDADGFGVIELPERRSGLLTLSAFLTAGARPSGSSPVARGLIVNASMLCARNPPFPVVVNPETGQSEEDPNVASAVRVLADASEFEKAEYRAQQASCAGCHSQFDAFGMVLEPFDALGRIRDRDSEGRVIDETWTTVTLPESVGGSTVTSAAETARAVVGSGAFERCMALNFINYALTESSRGGASGRLSQPTSSCAVHAVMNEFLRTDRSFSSLIREIAASETLAVRSQGE